MRRTLLTALLILIPIGFATKLYTGPGAWWCNRYAGGILYEMFWILVVLAVWPRFRPVGVATGVFVITSFLEALQLWKPPLLEAVRSTFLGRTTIGTTFDWWDFPHYAIGCIAGILLVHLVIVRS